MYNHCRNINLILQIILKDAAITGEKRDLKTHKTLFTPDLKY